MKTQTQGPWHNNGADIFQGGKKDRLIAFCGYGATNEIEANARLIAAAPELLELAELALGELNYDTSMDTTRISIRNRLRATIAKAKWE